MPKSKLVKAIIFILIVAALFIAKEYTVLGEYMTASSMQTTILSMGAWGIIIFLLAFVVGTTFQIPGILFYGLAILTFDGITGGIIAYVGSVLAVAANFYFARVMGGKLLTEIKNKRVQGILDKVENYPIPLIGFLRTFMWVSPPLNYALAFSGVSSKKYIVGSAIGLTVPALLFLFAFPLFENKVMALF